MENARNYIKRKARKRDEMENTYGKLIKVISIVVQFVEQPLNLVNLKL